MEKTTSQEKREVDKGFKNLKTKEMKASSTVSLTILNDNCLLHVLSYLPIQDVINVEQTCKRLKNVAHLYYRTTKTLVWTSDLPYARAPKIIVKFGRYTTSLHLLHFDGVQKPQEHCDHYNDFIGAILDNCKNIKSLKFTNCDVGYEWAPFFDALQYLECLTLHYTQLKSSNYLRRVNTLKYLEIHGANSFSSSKFNYLLANNIKLERLMIHRCENLSRGLRYDIIGRRKLKSLSVEVYPENCEPIDEIDIDDEEEWDKLFQDLKELKITQGEKNLNLNSFLKQLTENAKLDKLELCKFNVDQNTFSLLKSMNLKSLNLYPKFKDEVMSICQMLVDAMPNLKHLKLMLFDADRDIDLSDYCMLYLIERLKHLESLNLYRCETECGCDYVVCPFRCKLRSIIEKINDIFQQNLDRPTLKLMLPRHVSSTYFQAKRKVQAKYRGILTDRVSFIRPLNPDFPKNLEGSLEELFIDFMMECDSDIEEPDFDSTSTDSDPESHPEDNGGFDEDCDESGSDLASGVESDGEHIEENGISDEDGEEDD